MSLILYPRWHGFCYNVVKNSYLYELSIQYPFTILPFRLCFVGVCCSAAAFLRFVALYPAAHPRGDSAQADRDVGARPVYQGLAADRHHLPYSPALCASQAGEQHPSRASGARAADVRRTTDRADAGAIRAVHEPAVGEPSSSAVGLQDASEHAPRPFGAWRTSTRASRRRRAA